TFFVVCGNVFSEGPTNEHILAEVDQPERPLYTQHMAWPFDTNEPMMFDAGTLTFQEFVMSEPLPLATIQNSVLEFLRGRDDGVVFGAQAVNAYVPEPRMTQDIDLLSTRAAELAEELRDHLSQQFHVAIRVREIGEGRGYRLFQIQKSGNRHFVDVRPVNSLPPARRVAGVLVMAPAGLIASKVISYHRRRGKPKSGTDWRDIAMLLLQFPELKQASGPVADCIRLAGVEAEVLAAWDQLVAQEIQAPDDEDEF
ncbi:MAG TPA: nucleotidyl transferase AbiEii/AbiGii toxin family protein, partial [Blastocatellia bacterium]|nr:nucleotidyl transferase AbiEii/AbiGii toxin family protein [Blastocatellia bacterium]